MSLDTETGEDPTKAIVAALGKAGYKATRDAAHLWFAESHDRLVEAAEQRAGTSDRADDSESQQYRRQNRLTDMLDEFWAPVWDDSRQAWVWGIAHEAAVFHEFGATPHEIEARQADVLAFEWPDAPEEVKERFQSTFPTVFFDSVQHPGTPAIGMVRYGRERARTTMENAGLQVDDFGFEGDSS